MRPADQERISRVFELAVELDGWLQRRLRRAGAAPAARELSGEFDRLDDKELLHLDARARSYSSPLWGDCALWRPREAGEPVIEGALQRLGAVAPNGFVRQRSLIGLGAAGSEEVLARLALIRSTDWVSEVRHEALGLLRELDPGPIVRHLPLGEHLAWRRERGSELGELIDDVLSGDEAIEALRAGCELPDRHVRRSSWRRLFGTMTQPGPRDVSTALLDEDLIVRKIAADNIRTLAPEDQRGFAARLRQDPVGTLRARGLAIEVELGVATDSQLRVALRDRAAAVRLLARYHWEKRGHVALIVYQQPEPGRPTAIDLIGVGECGNSQQAPWLREHLAATSARLRSSAVRALGRVDPKFAATAEQMLDDPSPAVSKAALAALRGTRVEGPTLERCAARAVADPRPHVRQSMIALLRHSTWTALEAALRLTKDSDEAVRASAANEIRAWLKRSAHVNGKPAPDQGSRIDELLVDADPVTRREVDFIILTSA